MTTILTIVLKEGVVMVADSRVTEGNLKLPINYPKIESPSDNIIVAGAGSVGNVQTILREALRSCYISKALTDDFQNNHLSPTTLIKAISELNFSLPLEYKHYTTFGLIVAGFDQSGIKASVIGDDASIIDIEKYYAMGSGSQLAFTLLQEGYDPNLTIYEGVDFLCKILNKVSELDSFTDCKPSIFAVTKNDVIKIDINKPKEVISEKVEVKN